MFSSGRKHVSTGVMRLMTRLAMTDFIDDICRVHYLLSYTVLVAGIRRSSQLSSLCQGMQYGRQSQFKNPSVGPFSSLQQQFRLDIPFLVIARPQPQFPHSCVFERFIYSQDQSTYFLQQNRQTHRGNI
jgi:hypothetical protein